MKTKLALFFLLCPLLSLGGMASNPSQAQTRERCPYAEIYVEDEPPIETRAICQAAEPLAAEGLRVAIFVTHSTYTSREFWNIQEEWVKNEAGLQQWGEQNFAPDGLFLAVSSGQLVVLETPVVLTLGDLSYRSSSDADRITEVMTQEIEAGLRNDALTQGIVTALEKTHRLLYNPQPNIALILSISLPTGAIIVIGGVLLYWRRNQISPSRQQLEQMRHLIENLHTSSHAEAASCEQTRQWVEDITRTPERYIQSLREMVHFIEVQVTQEQGFLNFCRRLWRRGQPRFPEPKVQAVKRQDDAGERPRDKWGRPLTSSASAPAIDVDTMQTNPEQGVQDDATTNLDGWMRTVSCRAVVVEARQSILLIQQLIAHQHYLPALEIWKQTQIDLVQFAIAHLQQRRQAAEVHYFEWQQKSESVLKNQAKYSQYLETIKQRLETGNITELLKLQRELVSLLYFVKRIEQSADNSLEFKRRKQRGGISSSGSPMSSKDVDRIINNMFNSERR